jgi:hypothetical protein
VADPGGLQIMKGSKSGTIQNSIAGEAGGKFLEDKM